jgi:hypothetical protein
MDQSLINHPLDLSDVKSTILGSFPINLISCKSVSEMM